MTEIDEARMLANRMAEAAAWHMYLTEAQAYTTPEFESWLSKPGNASAWEQATAVWGYLGTWAREPELVAIRQSALGVARRSVEQLRRPPSLRRFARPIAAALTIAVLGAIGLYLVQRPKDFTTSFNERRTITLADGSHVSLDSDSELTVRYSQNARELHLIKGQARFDVAHDLERPFSVLAREEKVIATGTAFVVDITQPEVLVTLIEGHVVVVDDNDSRQFLQAQDAGEAPPSLQRRTIELSPGQQLAALPKIPPKISSANIEQATAWTSGLLIFKDQPLSEVVDRVNHYSSVHIAISDPNVREQRVSGVFNAGDLKGFLSIITDYLPIRAVANDNGDITLQKK